MSNGPVDAGDRRAEGGERAGGGDIGRIVLDRAGVKRLMRAHPWIHADKVARVHADDGTLVRLEGPEGVPRGLALWNSGSRLALRVLSVDPRDEARADWWRAPLDAAIARRHRDLAPDVDGCRWVHGEADGLPGLVVDRYADVAVVQAGCLATDRALPELARHLVDAHGLRGVLARHDGGFRRAEKLAEEVRLLAGEVPERVVWHQADCEREVDPWHGQKTGTYLDQRENQVWAAARLPVGRALDVCCNDGGFALHLARAGSDVLALDASADALARTARHAELAGVSARVTSREANVFDELRALSDAGERFDTVVLDPPALAKQRKATTAARRGYRELNLRALRMLRPGGRLLTCSCSFHLSAADFEQVLAEAAAGARVRARVLARRGAASCHPVRLGFPESDYLKVVLLERD